MTRLQKKCLIAVMGTHLMIVIVLACSGFIRPSPKIDDSQILEGIPLKAIDAALNSGVRNAVQPPPTPVVEPPTPTPTPPQQQQPVQAPVQPPKPAPEPVHQETPPPQDTRPSELPTPEKPKKPHPIDVDLNKKVTRKPTDDPAAQAKEEAREAARQAKLAADARARAVRTALNKISKNASSATSIDMPGDSTVAYANYASIVKTVYTVAWNVPEDAASDDANVKVSVTIANDGHVMESHIVEPSGDASVDRSVQRTLDQVQQIEPFPDGASEKQRTYIINFNLKAKRMLG